MTLLIFGVSLVANAQKNDSRVTISLSKPEISLANQEIADFTVKVHNNSNTAIAAYFDVELSTDLKLLSKDHVPVSLQPGDSLFVPIKVFVNKQAIANKSYDIKIALSADKKVIAETSCKVGVIIKKNVSLIALVTNILLNPQLDSLSFPISVANGGNTLQKVSVIVQLPFRIEGADRPYTIKLSLPPGADTVIYFKRAVNRKMLSMDEFDISITGIYFNGEIFGMGYVKIQTAKDSRRFTNADYDDNYEYNSMSIASQNIFDRSQNYLFTGRGGIDLPDGKLAYSVDVTTYQNNYSPNMIRNTYISYETHNMGLTLGNISRNFEINLSGQGASAFVNDTARHNIFDAGYINANSNLFAGTPYGLPSFGTAGWLSAGHINKKWDILSTFLIQKSPFFKTNNMIFSNRVSWTSSTKFNITATLNGGNTMDINSSDHKYSIAAGINVTGRTGNWQYTSINLLSSAYYPGINRGATNLSQRISHLGSGLNEWVNLTYYNYLPKYFSNTLSYLPQYGNLRVELGASKKYKHVTLSVAPIYNKESNNSYLLFQNSISLQGKPMPLSFFRSIDLNTTLAYPISLTRYFTVNLQGGVYNSTVNANYQSHYHLTTNYADPYINLNASLQYGGFYIGEILVNNSSSSPNKIIMISPSFHTTFLRKKAVVFAGVTYLNNSTYGSSVLLTGRFAYDVIPKTTIYMVVNENRYKYLYGVYNNSVLEAGVTRKLPAMKIGSKNGILEVLVYKDINHNDTYDSADSVSANTLVYINDIAFITKANGTITYKDLPAGNYRIAVSNNKGWYAPEQSVSFTKKHTVQIPLDRIGTVKGSVDFSFKEFSYEIRPEKSGITITATDDNNRIFTTQTGPDGRYVFYIPTGTYTINCSQETLPAEVECTNNDQKVKINFNSEHRVSFNLSIKNRKIEVKRFVSPSMKKDRNK